MPELDPTELRLSPRDMVKSDLCIGCGACSSSEEGPALRWDSYGQLKPDKTALSYTNRTASFARLCPFSPSASNEDVIASERFPSARLSDGRLGRFEAAYVGHAAEESWRSNGSSGGLVSWTAAELMRTGEVDAVAHVKAVDPSTGRFFAYGISRSPEELAEGAKSRYYPVDLSAVLAELRSEPGRYAFVGVPCFIKALNLLRRTDPLVRERLTHTLGLFCGHMKSARLVESFAWQMGERLEEVQALDYRQKDPDRPANWYRARLDLKGGHAAEEDWWNLADGDWGAGFFQNTACNFCDDVVSETADISFGDAWVEPHSSDGRGTNVIVVRTPELRQMIEGAIAEGRLDLNPVDADFVAETQAAGLRHRREGLAYRLSWGRSALVRSIKRVEAASDGLPLRRRLVFRTRAAISRWSHRVMWLSRTLRMPKLYVAWARASLQIYKGLAWSQGTWGKLFDRLFSRSDSG